MLARLSQDLGGYLYDVFVARLDLWFALGFGAQMIFTARFLVQWIESERQGRSVVPLAFWVLSIVGGFLTLLYGIARHDAIIILGQALSLVIYGRNLALIAKNARKQRETTGR